MDAVILFLIIIGLGALAAAGYFLYQDLQQHDEIALRLGDLETATDDYCIGEFNGAYSRMRSRQKNKNKKGAINAFEQSTKRGRSART